MWYITMSGARHVEAPKTNTHYVEVVLRWWVAVDAHEDSEENRVRSDDNIAVFRTQENALDRGPHEWQINIQAGQWGLWAEWRATGLICETTNL